MNGSVQSVVVDPSNRLAGLLRSTLSPANAVDVEQKL
jgi:hypothetical protein